MIALTIFLAEAINSSEAMRPDEYQNCLDMLQTLSMSPLAVNEDNIVSVTTTTPCSMAVFQISTVAV